MYFDKRKRKDMSIAFEKRMPHVVIKADPCCRCSVPLFSGFYSVVDYFL